MIVQDIKRLWSTSSRPGGVRQVPGVAVVEVVGDEHGLKDVTVPEEGLVVAKEGGMRHTSVWRRGDS